MIDGGHVTRADRGAYDIRQFAREAIAHLMKLERSGADKLTAERVRLAAAQSKRIELQIAEREASLLPVEEVESEWQMIREVVTKERLRIPQAAEQVAAMAEPGKVETLLHEIVNDVLTFLSGGKALGEPKAKQ